MDTLEKYDILKSELQPFRTPKDVYSRSYYGRALEMRSIISEIH